MRIADHLLRELSHQFVQIEGELSLLRWVDNKIGDASIDLLQFLKELGIRLQGLAQARSSGLYTCINGDLISLDQAYNQEHHSTTPVVSNLVELQSLRGMTHQRSNAYVINSTDDNSSRLYVTIASHNFPEIVIVLEAPLYGEDGFYGSSLLNTAEMIASRSAVLIDHHLALLREKHTQALTREFLLADTLGSSSDLKEDRIEELLDDRWLILARMVIGYLPPWSPFALLSPPLVQILTVEGEQPEFLTLRATHGHLALPHEPLRRDRSIAGLFLDREREEPSLTHLLLNPTLPEFRTRYAAYLYPSIPQSELIVPIRSSDPTDGRIVALVNLEHPEPDIFTEFHVDCVLQSARYITEYVNYLGLEERRIVSRERLSRYILLRVFKRLTDSHLHTIGNKAPMIRTALSEIEPAAFAHFTKEEFDDFSIMRDGVLEITKLSTRFLENLSDNMTYGEIDLNDQVRRAIDDFDPERILETEGITIEVELDRERHSVFGSGMLREHINSIIKNSLDVIRTSKPTRQHARGFIKIATARAPNVDLQGRQNTFEFSEVRVEDNGGGLPVHLRGKVPSRGVTSKRDMGGSGFGLSAAQGYVEGIGGGFQLLDRPGEGLTVCLYLPVFTPSYHRGLAERMNVPGMNRTSEGRHESSG